MARQPLTEDEAWQIIASLEQRDIPSIAEPAERSPTAGHGSMTAPNTEWSQRYWNRVWFRLYRPGRRRN